MDEYIKKDELIQLFLKEAEKNIAQSKLFAGVLKDIKLQIASSFTTLAAGVANEDIFHTKHYYNSVKE